MELLHLGRPPRSGRRRHAADRRLRGSANRTHHWSPASLAGHANPSRQPERRQTPPDFPAKKRAPRRNEGLQRHRKTNSALDCCSSLLQHHEGEKTTIPWYKKPNTRVRTVPPHTAATHGTRHQRPTNRTPNTRVRALPPHTAATHGARHQRPTGQAPRPGRSRSPRMPQPRRRRRAAPLPPPRRGPSRTAPSPAARSPRARPPRT